MTRRPKSFLSSLASCLLLAMALLTAAMTSTAAQVTLDTFNPAVDGPINCMAQQPDGKILVGGAFTNLAGGTRFNIGRLHPDGTLDVWFNPGVTGSVSSITIQSDGKILVGGFFSSLGNQTRANIGRLNSDGTLDVGFNPVASSSVWQIEEQIDGRILVAGSFYSIAGQLRRALARLNSDGTLDTAFDARIGGGNGFLTYNFAQQPDGRIVLGGGFTNVAGSTRKGIARLNSDSTLDPTFNPGVVGRPWELGAGYASTLAIQNDERIIVSGYFTNAAGQTRTNLARINASGGIDGSFNPGVAPVSASMYYDPAAYSVAFQTDGKIVVAGSMENIAGQARQCLARLNGDGTLDASCNIGANASVRSLLVQPDGKILVSGRFTNLGGATRPFLRRLVNSDPATQNLSVSGNTITWLRGGSSPEVWRTTFDHSPDGRTWNSLGAGTRIAGGWQCISASIPSGGTLRARGWASGANDASWFAETMIGQPAFVSHPSGQTNVFGTNIVFTAYAGGAEPLSYQWLKDGSPIGDGGAITGARTNTLRFNAIHGGNAGDYSLVVSNAAGSVTSSVAQLTVIDPVIFAHPVSQRRNLGEAGSMSVTAEGTDLTFHWRKNGVPIENAGSALLVWTNLSVTDAGFYTVEASGIYGSVSSTGAFLTVNAVTVDPAFNPGADGIVFAFNLNNDGSILAGGAFTTLGALPSQRLGWLNANGTAMATFNPGANSTIYALAAQTDGKVLIGGSFTNLLGQTRKGIARIDASGLLDTAFNPGTTGTVRAIAIQADGSILLGGDFTMMGGLPRNRLARLMPGGMVDADFDPGGDSTVNSLAIQANGQILVGGGFTNLAGQPRRSIGRLNANGTVDPDFHPDANALVNALAMESDGRILIGGSFTNIGGQARYRIARLNIDGTVAADFDPSIPNKLGAPTVNSIAVHADSRITIAGDLTAVSGQQRTNLARINYDGSLDLTFDLGTIGPVQALAIRSDGGVLLGGQLLYVGGQARNRIASLLPTDPATQTLTFDGSTIRWLRGGTCPEVWRTTFEVSTNGTNWTLLGVGTRIAGGWQFTGLSLASNAVIRARGFVTGGYNNASSWFEESTLSLSPPSPPVILTGGGQFGMVSNRFGFMVSAPGANSAVVEASTNLVNWLPLATNALSNGLWYFVDPGPTNLPQQFYRTRFGP